MANIISSIATIAQHPLAKPAMAAMGGSMILKITGLFHASVPINELRYYLFDGGAATLMYVGAMNNLKESCSQSHSKFACITSDYTNAGIAIISAIFGIAITANTIIKLVTRKSILDHLIRVSIESSTTIKKSS